MLGTYFYHEIIRKNVIGFGNLFNEIYITHQDSSGNQKSEILVPIAYGPIQKFLARIEQQPDNKKQSLTLPRMSFEMNSIQYDSTRKGSPVQTFKSVNLENNNIVNKAFMPVPYNLGFQLNIFSKLQDDALQIVEQIIPFFQPAFNITIDLVSSIGEKRDTPVVLNSITFKDDYEGDYSNRRYLLYTLNFTSKTNFFGPVVDNTNVLIKKVKVNFFSNTDRNVAKREVRYTLTPRATKDYNDDNTTTLVENINTKVNEFEVLDSSTFTTDTYIRIDNESMQIKSISGNVITVHRAVDGSTLEDHLANASIDIINSQDDDLISLEDAFTDDFGFNETVEFFNDGGKTYSPSLGQDV